MRYEGLLVRHFCACSVLC